MTDTEILDWIETQANARRLINITIGCFPERIDKRVFWFINGQGGCNSLRETVKILSNEKGDKP